MNLIIKETDPLYDKIEELHNKYNGIPVRKIGKSSQSLQYYIPPELVIKDKVTSRGTVVTSNPKNDSDNWVNMKSIGYMIYMTCNMNIQDMYDLLNRRCNDRDNRPKCKNCGKQLDFYSISKGYGHHSNIDAKNLFCNKSCQAYYMHWSGEYQPTGLKKTEALVRTASSWFCNHGNLDDKCVMYLAKLSTGDLKLGITENMINRSHKQNTGFYPSSKDVKYLKWIILKEDSRLNIANLEYKIKVNILNKGSETIPDFKTLIKIIHFIKNN